MPATDYITKLDIPYRRAIVEKELFGRIRQIKSWLWMDADPKLPRLETLKGTNLRGMQREIADIGIHPEDEMREESTYGDLVLEVEAVDSVKCVLRVVAELFGSKVRIELSPDSVEKVDE